MNIELQREGGDNRVGGERAGASFVSVVTPFYNSADTLQRCIDSVLAQSHGDFEYILSDNASDDGSGEIARAAALRDPRVVYIHWDALIPQTENYNRALRQVSPKAAYVKIVQADDLIFESCLSEMVGLGRRYPGAGVIGGVRRIGRALDPVLAELPHEITDGREICRETLATTRYAFGSPTSVMYRADLVRGRDEFFRPKAFFDDTDAIFDLLQTSDFAFSSKVLTETTRDANSTLGRVQSFDLGTLHKFMTLHRIGARYFCGKELDELKARLTGEYYEAVAGAIIKHADWRGYLRFHHAVLRDSAGMRIRFIPLLQSLTRHLGRAFAKRATSIFRPTEQGL